MCLLLRSVWQDFLVHLALLQEKADARVTCTTAVSMFLGQGWGRQAGSKVAFSTFLLLSQQGSLDTKPCVRTTVLQHVRHSLNIFVVSWLLWPFHYTQA